MTFAKIQTLLCKGLCPQDVTIEALATRGLSQLTLSGLPNLWLKEAKDKIKSLVSSRVSWGALDRVLVHLLPADTPKAGAHLELPITLACMVALDPHISQEESLLKRLREFKFIGALTLTGELQATSLSDTLESLQPEIVLGPRRFKTLDECWSFIRGQISLPLQRPLEAQNQQNEFFEIHVNQRAWEKYWLLLCAIADLPMFLIGPPGLGKSTLARWAHRLTPQLLGNQALEVDLIWRLAQRQNNYSPPLMVPHSRTHVSEFLGSGDQIPGIFSLSHGGLLVLDEVAELNRDCREILRIILDEKKVLKNTKQNSAVWPAHFWMIATANPCPCGKSKGKNLSECTCTYSQRIHYQNRISKPLLDRFGMKLFVDEFENKKAPFEFDSSLLNSESHSLRMLVSEMRSNLKYVELEFNQNKNYSYRKQKQMNHLYSAALSLQPELNAEDFRDIFHITTLTAEQLLAGENNS